MLRHKVVISQSDISAGQQEDFWRMVGDGTINGRIFGYFLGHIAEIREKTYGDTYWLEEILRGEKKRHRKFFGREFDLTKFEATLQKCGSGKIEQWKSLGLEPHFLPGVVMPQNAEFPGWKKKPENWYYNKVAEEKILRRQPDGQLMSVREVKLEGIVVLVDTRLKPAYNNGEQMFENDNLLGPIIERLRQQGKIADYNLQTSRFNVSAEEWQDQIRPALAGSLGVEISQVRLETVIEADVIPQLYSHMARRRDGETDTWVWYEEYVGGASNRLRGGCSVYGGLSNVYCYSFGYHWYHRAFRPLVVLA